MRTWKETARKVFVALLVLSLHLLMAQWLLQHPRLTPAQEDERMQLRLLPRDPVAVPAAAAAPSATTSAQGSAHARPASTGTLAALPEPPGSSSAQMDDPGAGGTRRALDLSLPPQVLGEAAGGASERQPWERPPPVDYRSTRFNRAWTPDGGPIQQTWAFRSKIAGFVLAATGALDLPCTEEERRQLLERCAGKQYQGDDGPPTISSKH